MAENNALDTKEKADAWLAGEVVEGISITIDDFKNSRRNAGWTEQQIKDEIDNFQGPLAGIYSSIKWALQNNKNIELADSYISTGPCLD